MQVLIEAVGMLVIVAGVLVFGLACAWSARTLKRETGSVFSPSVIAGAFVFYNLIVKIGNGSRTTSSLCGWPLWKIARSRRNGKSWFALAFRSVPGRKG